MPLPTLLSKGAVVKNKHIDKEDVGRIDRIKAIDYVLNFIDRRMGTSRMSAKIPPKKMGSRVILLRSGTGSGKSTTIAPELYNKFQKKANKNIIITQPRILTAIDKSKDMANIFEFLKLGKNIGFQTGTRSLKPNEKGITSMTPGILLNILSNNENEAIARRYSFIIIDEIHEKDINTETNLFLIKKFLTEYWKEDTCPFIVLMSATFNPDKYIKYFDCPPENFIEVHGRTFPIAAHHPKYDVSNYVNYTIKTALQLHVNNLSDLDTPKPGQVDSRDIMIFIKDKGVAKVILKALRQFNETLYKDGWNSASQYVKSLPDGLKRGGAENKHYLLPILLNRQSFQTGGKDYRNLFSDIKYLKVSVGDKLVRPSRKVIVSTPVAETGITVETLKYCVDSGWVLSPEFNPDYGIEILLNRNVTDNMVHQRKGRVGRLAPGEWYPAYTEKNYKEVPEDLFSKFISEDITVFLLNIICTETEATMEEVNMDDLSDKEKEAVFQYYTLRQSYNIIKTSNNIDFSSLDFFSPPPAANLCHSLEKLYVLGFINSDYTPTLLGYFTNRMRKVEIEPIRMVFAGYSHGANILDLITMAAFVLTKKRNICGRKYNFRNPAGVNEGQSRFYNRVLIADEFIDAVFLWEEFMTEMKKIETLLKKNDRNFSVSHIQKWCDENNVYYDGLMSMIYKRDEIIESLISLGMNPYYNGLGLEKGTYKLGDIFKKNLDEGIDEIKKIKRCILDGYRFHLAKWNEKLNRYILIHKPIGIKVKSKLTSEISAEQKRPMYIIAESITLMPDFERLHYKFESNTVSVLDGFVDVDPNFTKS